MIDNELDFIAACQARLALLWEKVYANNGKPSGVALAKVQADTPKLIRECLTAKVKTYHYVLPTQLLAKLVDGALDAHSLQSAYGGAGAFDARTVAHKVIVPFDQEHQRVLGGSPEPYVNNPLRVPGLMPEHRAQQKDKQTWDTLVSLIDKVELAGDPAYTEAVLEITLAEIYGLLAEVSIVYPTPNRISLQQTQRLLHAYLSSASGGERMEALCTALFETIGVQFGLFDDVRREKVNASDAASGMSADIECRSGGKIVLLIEVKDRSLTLTQVDAKLDIARARHISELLFIASSSHNKDVQGVEERIATEFVSGQNIYVASFEDFALGVFILLGEQGRVRFLDAVGQELDRANAEIRHRRAWASVLKEI